MSSLFGTIAETPLASEGYTLLNVVGVSDAAVASSTISYRFTPGGVFNENATANVSISGALKRKGALAESAKASSGFALKRTAALTSTATASSTITPMVGFRQASSAKATDAITGSASYHLALTETGKARAGISPTSSRALASAAVASSTISYTYTAQAAFSDVAHASIGATVTRTARAALTETLIGTDGYAGRAQFNAALIEKAQASAQIDWPGSHTTWVINTRSTAITEYQSFQFNSFAAMGRKYIAADNNGLYELNGNTDLTAPVIATVGSGYTQMNGSKFVGLKGVYFGSQGQGVYQLRLIAGDGRQYVYNKASNPGLMTTKVNIGKGLHMRYLAWELTNLEGQDFDLDTVELVPMMSGRRVG